MHQSLLSYNKMEIQVFAEDITRNVGDGQIFFLAKSGTSEKVVEEILWRIHFLDSTFILANYAYSSNSQKNMYLLRTRKFFFHFSFCDILSSSFHDEENNIEQR